MLQQNAVRRLNPPFMQIKNITIIGTGNLGTRIGLQAAISGYQVIFYDITDAALEKAKSVIDKVIGQLIKAGTLTNEQKQAALPRISYTTDLKIALADCDLISESVTEELSIKEKVWKQIGDLAPTKTIFTTNTSYLLPSQLATISGRPEKFCAFHYFIRQIQLLIRCIALLCYYQFSLSNSFPNLLFLFQYYCH